MSRPSPLRRPALVLGALVATCAGTALAAPGTGRTEPTAATVRPEVHTRLEESTPADGDTVPVSLEQFRLRFSAPVEASLSELRLHGPDGGDTVLAVRGFADSATVLRAPTPRLRPGVHRLRWRTVSADGHAVEGELTFTVTGDAAADAAVPPGVPSAVPGDGPPVTGTTGETAKATEAESRSGPPSEARTPLRGTLLAGLGLACLLAAAGLLWFTGGTDLVREPRVLRATSATALGAVILLTLALLDWLVGVMPADVGRIDGMLAALGTRTGATDAMRIVLALLVFFLVGGAHAGRLSAMLAMIAVVLGSAAGHPASIEPSVAIGANALHVGAAAIWLGGVLLLALLPDRSELAGPDWRYADVAKRVSARAFLAVGIIVGTAVVQDFLFLDALPQLWETAYGRLLLAKGAGLGLLVGFGAWHRWRTLPRLALDGDPGPLRRAVRIEIWVLVGVVLVAAWLSRVPAPVAG